jgi:hypothetical protein
MRANRYFDIRSFNAIIVACPYYVDPFVVSLILSVVILCQVIVLSTDETENSNRVNAF